MKDYFLAEVDDSKQVVIGTWGDKPHFYFQVRRQTMSAEARKRIADLYRCNSNPHGEQKPLRLVG